MKKAILLITMFAALLVTGQTTRPTCKGTTKAGKPCQSQIINKDGFCRSHDPKALKCGAIKKDGKPCQMVVSTQGSKCKFHNPGK